MAFGLVKDVFFAVMLHIPDLLTSTVISGKKGLEFKSVDKVDSEALDYGSRLLYTIV